VQELTTEAVPWWRMDRAEEAPMRELPRGHGGRLAVCGGCQWEALTVDMEDGVWLASGRRLVAGDFKVVFSLASDEEKVLRGSGL
jgi:hypothetical protein